MNSILKWLHKNEGLVHTCVMFAVFYGIPTAALSIFYPHLVVPLVNSAVVGSVLIVLLYVSYKSASAVTEWIKSAVTHATLDQMRDLALEPVKVIKDPVVDYTSSNVLVVSNTSDETKEAVSNLKAAASTAPVVNVPASVDKSKKRPIRSKSSKKGG